MPGYVHLDDARSLRRLTGGILYDHRVCLRFGEEGFQVDCFDLDTLPRTAKFLRFPATACLRRNSPDFDILVSDLGNSTLTMGFQEHARRTGRLTVLICHHFRSGLESTPLRRLLHRYSEARVVGGAQLLVANSPHTVSVLKSMGRHQGDIVLAPPGLSVPVASEPVCRDEPREILSVCGIEPRKGVMEMVRALGASGLPDITLTIAGDLGQDTGYTKRVLELIGELGLSSRVRLPGRMTREELVGAYGSADAFMLLSGWEGYGMAIAEAMASGLPIISTTAGAIPGLVEDGEAGLLVAPGDWKGAAERIDMLFTDRGLRRRLASEALKRASGFPTWEETTGRTVNAVRERLAGRREPR
ncbi:MAG: glycosyltransferase [Candidatus Fermentibacteraceae bacterium]|nr:glycosyltransferase [Candidatus Fermentibacteraceae bacterium]MBN2608836.1 glycosyltransferase [Candidatus Fermentibacteraceae bacterium]